MSGLAPCRLPIAIDATISRIMRLVMNCSILITKEIHRQGSCAACGSSVLSALSGMSLNVRAVESCFDIVLLAVAAQKR